MKKLKLLGLLEGLAYATMQVVDNLEDKENFAEAAKSLKSDINIVQRKISKAKRKKGRPT